MIPLGEGGGEGLQNYQSHRATETGLMVQLCGPLRLIV